MERTGWCPRCRREGYVVKTLRTGRIALFKMRNCSRFASLISPNWMVSAGFFGSRAFSSPDILRLGMVGAAICLG